LHTSRAATAGTYDPQVPSTSPATRERSDLCPGVVTVHQAADGGLARVRLPGGGVTGAQLATLAAAAAELGDGRLELTSRGNVQIRALAPGAEIELGSRLTEAGLLPSSTHERVRNIVASPMAGIDGSGVDLSRLVTELDGALCARPALAQLPGRFLFAVDDGRGDVARLGADVTVVVGAGRAYIGPLDVTVNDAVHVAVVIAAAFLAERAALNSTVWRIDELSGGRRAVALRALSHLAESDVRMSSGAELPSTVPAQPVGISGQPGGEFALTVLAPLGRLSAEQARLLAEHAGQRGLRITPWRSVVVPDLADPDAVSAAFAAAGLGVDATSKWYRLSACTGRPGCGKALADVQADARAAAGERAGQQVHWSGCERRCGRPHDTKVDIVASTEGYRTSE
jgi:precorrin-3B synthase